MFSFLYPSSLFYFLYVVLFYPSSFFLMLLLNVFCVVVCRPFMSHDEFLFFFWACVCLLGEKKREKKTIDLASYIILWKEGKRDR